MSSKLKKDAKREDIIKVLTKRCGMNSGRAATVADKINTESTTSSPLNIILFGEAGIGKSSVINLIAGKTVAKTSPDATGCTLSFQQHSFSVKNRKFNIWDTVGLEAAVADTNGYLSAIEQACDLTNQLAKNGGVDLLLFCIRGTRITVNVQNNYRLFYEVLCRSQVPIALVFTHLEQEEIKMEDWWERNAVHVDKYGIKAAGHACVTGLPKNPRYLESQENMVKLLEGHSGNGTFQMPSEGWIIGFLRLFRMFSKLKKDAKKNDIIKILTKRCGMDPKTAAIVVDKLVTDVN